MTEPTTQAESALADAVDRHGLILELLISALDNALRGNYVIALCGSAKAVSWLNEAVDRSDFDVELEAEYER